MITLTPTPTPTPTLDDTDHRLRLRNKQESAARQEAAAAAAPASSPDDLFPGLPEDMARECLLRVGFQHLPAARRVSRAWKAELESPSHHRSRRRHALLALAQARPPLVTSGPARKYAASAGAGYSFRLVLHDPADGSWSPLPAPPGAHGSGRLPLFCQLATAGEGPAAKLLVLGGWDPETWALTAAVHVYDFLSGTWRRGADMPPPRRSSFACAAAGGGWVFVAGGHDEEKNALRSAAAYDAEADAWTALPDMARERDEPGSVCVAGRFVVVGGYPTEAQGRFAGSAEAFDPATWSWGPVQERVVEDGACPRTCCAEPPVAAAGSRIMYMLRDGCVVARDAEGGDRWRTLARVPEDARAATTVAAIGDGRVVVLGAEQTVYVLSHDQATPSWTRVAAPPEFAGHVQAACCVQI